MAKPEYKYNPLFSKVSEVYRASDSVREFIDKVLEVCDPEDDNTELRLPEVS